MMNRISDHSDEITGSTDDSADGRISATEVNESSEESARENFLIDAVVVVAAEVLEADGQPFENKDVVQATRFLLVKGILKDLREAARNLLKNRTPRVVSQQESL